MEDLVGCKAANNLIENYEISIQALNSIQWFKTLKVVGYSYHRSLSILVDNGNTHNFIDCDLVSGLYY